MNSVLNTIDEDLHAHIYQEMLNKDPNDIFNNYRIPVLDNALSRVGNVAGNIADIGCGSGFAGIYIAMKYKDIARVDAIEGSKFAVEKLIPRNIKYFGVSNVNPVLMSFDNLPRESYNIVVALGSIHHSTNLRRTFDSIWEVLNLEGILFLKTL